MAAPEPMTRTAFLDWEERQDRRWEFDGVKPVPMPVETFCHAAIRHNLVSALIARLSGMPFQPYDTGSKIAAAGSVRYPDAFVAGPAVVRDAQVVADPVVVFEVLDPTTSDTDVWLKNKEYRDTPSILRYVMVAQDHQAATVFGRFGKDWLARIVSADGVLDMPEIGIEIPVSALYEGVVSDMPDGPNG
jgi:Uma2 family endonuclease